ncbi:MAG: site-2 protease family protein [Pirellulales bacterium]|nr:site-2 protease family protein [Pirellulales bacterium]
MPELSANFLLFGLIWYLVFLLSLTLHEAGHALAAYWMGDETAYLGGQVTINPLPHIQREPIGTVVLPLLSYLLTGNIWGWASAPYNLHWRLRYPGRALVMAMAGPLANFFLMVVTLAGMMALLHGGLINPEDLFDDGLLRYPLELLTNEPSPPLIKVYAVIFLVSLQNLILMVFNLIPVPPLDGSAIWQLVLPPRLFERYLEFSLQPSFVMLGVIAASGLFNRYLIGDIFWVYFRVLFWSF